MNMDCFNLLNIRDWKIVLIILLFLSMMSFAANASAHSKPRIMILATGGTIAGSAASSTATTGYTAGTLSIETLINAVPQVKDYANISGEQIYSIDSKDMTEEIWLKLANRINEIFSEDEADGIVITHGTDTLEETAYFLNLTVHSDKPVVLVGAMRPATAISADGSMNLLNAVRVAANSDSIGKGVLVSMNDTIFNARDVRKIHTLNVAAFSGGEIGSINGDTPKFYFTTTRKHTSQSEFDISGIQNLPRVKIIYGTAGDDKIFVDACINSDVVGIIFAGTGNGSIHVDAEKALSRAMAKGIVVVKSSRVGSGAVIAENLVADNLSPQKARILLQLALTKTNNLANIQRMFNEY